MMPDLGKYATAVLSAYGISILLIAGVIVLSLRASRKSRNRLSQLEERRKKNG